ncbi:hypothetical protein AMECASPLE_035074, partial [Ameca splendens]
RAASPILVPRRGTVEEIGPLERGVLLYSQWHHGKSAATPPPLPQLLEPPKAQESQENHRRDYRNHPREEQWRVPGEPPSSDSAEAPGSRSDKPTGPAGSRPRLSRSSHGPRDPKPRDTPPPKRRPNRELRYTFDIMLLGDIFYKVLNTNNR